jgi:hypothetical protein
MDSGFFAPKFFKNTATNDGFLCSPLTKKLIFDLHSTFSFLLPGLKAFLGIWCSACKLSAANNGQLQTEEYVVIVGNLIYSFFSALSTSKRYRRAIRDAIKATNGAYNELINAEILWSLTESIYLTPTGKSARNLIHAFSDNPIALDLIHWAGFCFGDSVKSVVERVNVTDGAVERHEFYWNAVSFLSDNL